ncbi:MAG: glycosyltransferase family 2 protein [Thermodesulfobacteriota bacterium]|jgi:putative glycosyltransferase
MKLSVVATLYQTAPNIDEFYWRTTAAAKSLTDDYEIVLVNDGSPDDSLARAVRLTEYDSHVIVVDLSRNFGHHKAMMTGLSYARGEQVFLIDSDLEEEPEWLLSFSEQMEQDRCDVVYGVQNQRKGGLFERWTGKWFYLLFRQLSGFALPENLITARLMTRRYVNALLLHREREIMIAGLWHITGFDQRPRTVGKKNTSETIYTLRRKMSVLVNSITSFSNAPLRVIFYIGTTTFLLAGGYTTYLIINWIFFAKPLGGWTSIMASIWLLGGAMISFIGVIGIYLSKIFMETKRRPYTIIRQIYGKKQE